MKLTSIIILTAVALTEISCSSFSGESVKKSLSASVEVVRDAGVTTTKAIGKFEVVGEGMSAGVSGKINYSGQQVEGAFKVEMTKKF